MQLLEFDYNRLISQSKVYLIIHPWFLHVDELLSQAIMRIA